MDNLAYEKRFERLETRQEKQDEKIEGLSTEVTENKVTMSFIREIMEELKNSVGSIEKNTKETSTTMQGIHFKVNALQEEVCDIKSKVEENDNAHKIDTRSLFKQIIEKIFIGIGVATIIGGIVYWISTMQ